MSLPARKAHAAAHSGKTSGHIARKRFGQNFLHDQGVIEAIVRAINPQAGEPLLEIGPGLAALTQPLVERAGQLAVIELDRDLAARLRQHPQLDVIESDVLKVDFTALAAECQWAKIRVVGNLPYNISTPILFHLLAHVAVVQVQHFMLQKEVVERYSLTGVGPVVSAEQSMILSRPSSAFSTFQLAAGHASGFCSGIHQTR